MSFTEFLSSAGFSASIVSKTAVPFGDTPSAKTPVAAPTVPAEISRSVLAGTAATAGGTAASSPARAARTWGVLRMSRNLLKLALDGEDRGVLAALWKFAICGRSG